MERTVSWEQQHGADAVDVVLHSATLNGPLMTKVEVAVRRAIEGELEEIRDKALRREPRPARPAS